MKFIIQRLFFIALAAGLTGCSNFDPNAHEAGTVISQGVILQVQPVTAMSNHSATNTAHTVGTVGGAVIGGMAGNTTEDSLNDQSTLQYIVKLNDSGRIFSVVQSVKESLRPGSHVLVTVRGDHATRVRLDTSYTTQSTPAAT